MDLSCSSGNVQGCQCANCSLAELCKVPFHISHCPSTPAGKHLVMYKDGDVQNAVLRNEAVEWLDKVASSARSGSPQKARSRASTGTHNPAEGSSPVSRVRPSSKAPCSPQRKKSRLQAGSQGSQPPRASKSGQSVRRASTGGDAHAEQLRPAASVQTSRRPGAPCLHRYQVSDALLQALLELQTCCSSRIYCRQRLYCSTSCCAE